MKRFLIVNADDFGLSPGVNRGIIECAEHGILTSASLMVRWPAAAEAAMYAKANRAMSAGLHVDLGECVLRGGEWEWLYQVVCTADAKAVEAEIYQQLAQFRQLVGRDPSHLDSHQHVHREEPARSIMIKLARELGVPLRGHDPRVHYCGDFYGQDGEGKSLPELLTAANLKAIFATLPEGITELGCHPGYGGDLASPYGSERVQEVRVLCDPAVRRHLESEEIELHSFDGLLNGGRSGGRF